MIKMKEKEIECTLFNLFLFSSSSLKIIDSHAIFYGYIVQSNILNVDAILRLIG